MRPRTETEPHTDAPIRVLSPEQVKRRADLNNRVTSESIRKRTLAAITGKQDERKTA